jgi:hypothetical protein
VGALTPLLGLGFGASLFRLGLLGRGMTLGLGLVLLGLALFAQAIAAGDRTDRLLGLALDVLDDALDAFCRSAVVRRESSSMALVCSGVLIGQAPALTMRPGAHTTISLSVQT